MDQLEEFLFEMPQVAKGFLRNIECAQRYNGAKECEIGDGIQRAVKCGQVKALLEPVRYSGERFNALAMSPNACITRGCDEQKPTSS